MAMFTDAEVVLATGARILQQGRRDMLYRNVTTDTRTVGEDDLFAALKGEKFDGHDFIEQAVSDGAAGVIVEDAARLYPDGDYTIFVVKNTRKAYQDLALFHRRRFSIPVVAVTGSAGKTSTRALIATVLEQKYNVLQTEKNFNNEIGLPRTLLQLTKEHGACVVELGMRGLGQIKELADIAEPTVGVVTNVGKSHIELLGSQAQIARAKGELVEALGSDGTAVLNQDDKRVAAMAGKCKGKVVGFGIINDAPVMAGTIKNSEKGLSFTCRCFDQVIDVHMAVIGTYNVYNALAAVAVGRLLGLSEHQMQKGLAEYKGVPMRQELVNIDNVVFVNDAYNANPASMKEAVDTLVTLTGGRKIAVLGGMLELGDWAEKEHEKIGTYLADKKVDVLIAMGDEARFMAKAAKAAGMNEVYTVMTHVEAAAVLRRIMRQGDTVLLKGSRGFAMEKILPYIERK
mgnify:FL=1